MRYLLVSSLLAMSLGLGACTAGGQMANSNFYGVSLLVPTATPSYTASGTGAIGFDEKAIAAANANAAPAPAPDATPSPDADAMPDANAAPDADDVTGE